MTVATDISKVPFAGDDVTVAFPLGVTFFFYDASDLVVYLEDETTGALTVQTINTHYTVTGGNGSTGTVTMVTAPTSDQKLWVQRVLPLTQLTDLQNNGLQDADTVELMSDKLTAIAQQLDDNLNLSLRAPISEDGGDDFILPSKSERAGKYLAFEDTADADPVARTPEQVVLGPALAAIQPLSPASGKLIEYTGATTAQLVDTSSVGGGLMDAGASSLATLAFKDFTIQSGTTRIHIAFYGITHSSAAIDLLVRIGPGGVPVASGYLSTACKSGVTNATGANSTAFNVYVRSTTQAISGVMTLMHIGSNLWVSEHVGSAYQVGVNEVCDGGGSVDATGEVDTVRILVPTGTFVTGAARVTYERSQAVT